MQGQVEVKIEEMESVAMQKLMQQILKNDVKTKKEKANIKMNKLQNND